MHSFLEWMFSFVCHQLPERCWTSDGYTMAVCYRCTGVYFGTVLWMGVLPWMWFQPTRRVMYIHALFILQMAGAHLVDQASAIRTLSGQLFITGILYFMWNVWRFHGTWWQPVRTPRAYWFSLLSSLILVQLLIHLPMRGVGVALETGSGAGVLLLCAVIIYTIYCLIKPTTIPSVSTNPHHPA